jgi:hypothetical protein
VHVCGNGPGLHVFQRETGQIAWSLARSRANLKRPTHFDFHFGQDDAVKFRLNSNVNDASEGGRVYRARVEPQGDIPDWLEHLFFHPHDPLQRGDAFSLVKGWQAIQLCEETNMLVFCCNGVLCLLKDYK